MHEKQKYFFDLNWLLVYIGCFNLLDFLATRSLVVHGDHVEGNPLMGVLISTPYFALYKLVAIPLGLIFLWLARKYIDKYLSLVKFTCALYLIVLIYTWGVFYF